MRTCCQGPSLALRHQPLLRAALWGNFSHSRGSGRLRDLHQVSLVENLPEKRRLKGPASLMDTSPKTENLHSALLPAEEAQRRWPPPAPPEKPLPERAGHGSLRIDLWRHLQGEGLRSVPPSLPGARPWPRGVSAAGSHPPRPPGAEPAGGSGRSRSLSLQLQARAVLGRAVIGSSLHKPSDD